MPTRRRTTEPDVPEPRDDLENRLVEIRAVDWIDRDSVLALYDDELLALEGDELLQWYVENAPALIVGEPTARLYALRGDNRLDGDPGSVVMHRPI